MFTRLLVIDAPSKAKWKRCGLFEFSPLSSVLLEQDQPDHRIYHDNENPSGICNMFLNKDKNGIIIQHPHFDCQMIQAPLTEELSLTFKDT